MYKTLKTHVHRRVLMQLITFGLVSLCLLAVVFYDAAMGQVPLWLVLAGLVGGVVVGYIVGKIFKLAWQQDTLKVVMSLDKTSFILIGLYVLFRIGSNELLDHYIQGAALTAFSFAFLGGLLFGRLVSVWSGVSRILREQGIL